MRTSQTHYLEAMGIQTWQRAYQLPGEKEVVDFEVYMLCNTLNHPVSKLCVEALSIPPLQVLPSYKLLDAMLSAIQLTRFPLLPKNDFKADFILLMGESFLNILPSRNTLEKMKVIAIYHPLDLLLNAAHKKKAWQDLKLFQSLLEGEISGKT